MSAKTWFITGAASGFGYHLTSQLLTRGDRVIATDLRPGPLGVLSDRYPDRLSVATLDITDVAAIRAVTADSLSKIEPWRGLVQYHRVRGGGPDLTQFLGDSSC